MRVTRLVLCLVLAACGGSKKPATMPAETAPAAAPGGGGEPAEGAAPAAEPVESTTPEPAMAPGAPAPEAATAPAPAPDAKPVTRGAKQKSKKTEDPDAGGE